MLYNFLLIIFVIDIVLLIPVILMQSGSGAQSGVFGGGAAMGAFGAKTSEVLVKFTRWLVIIFFVTALVLGLLKVWETKRYTNQRAIQQQSQTSETGTAAGE